jgi:hypothetical protein
MEICRNQQHACVHTFFRDSRMRTAMEELLSEAKNASPEKALVLPSTVRTSSPPVRE